MCAYLWCDKYGREREGGEVGGEVKSGWGGGGMSRGDKVGEIKEAREDGGVKRWRGQREERKKEKKKVEW